MTVVRVLQDFLASEQGGVRLESAALAAMIGIASATGTYYGSAKLNDQFERILTGLETNTAVNRTGLAGLQSLK